MGDPVDGGGLVGDLGGVAGGDLRVISIAQHGPVAVFATSNEQIARCRTFIAGLGGDPEDAEVFAVPAALIAAIDGGELSAVVIADRPGLVDARRAGH